MESALDFPAVFYIAGGLILLAIIIMLVTWSRRTSTIDLDASGSAEQSDWVRTKSTGETSAQLQQDGDLISTDNHDPGEKLASPFAEQIEDIIRDLLKESPGLAGVDVDLGSAPDGSLEIWINGEIFSSIDEISNEQVQQVFRQAIARWEAGQ
ncbi:MAG: hypothetical protein JXA25_01660 [Anaerolineales bacterium]|nr:hypothetical protein [Anaerolineales bacterium]